MSRALKFSPSQVDVAKQPPVAVPGVAGAGRSSSCHCAYLRAPPVVKALASCSEALHRLGRVLPSLACLLRSRRTVCTVLPSHQYLDCVTVNDAGHRCTQSGVQIALP